MAEQVTLPAPIPTTVTQTKWELDEFYISVKRGLITAYLLGDDGSTKLVSYPTPAPTNNPLQPTGASLLTSLNTANNSGANPSLVKRIYNRLITDGYITGTVVGVPS